MKREEQKKLLPRVLAAAIEPPRLLAGEPVRVEYAVLAMLPRCALVSTMPFFRLDAMLPLLLAMYLSTKTPCCTAPPS